MGPMGQSPVQMYGTPRRYHLVSDDRALSVEHGAAKSER
jgi:hypothetical protein